MSEETMTLNDDQLEQIGRYVQKNLPEWLRTLPPQTNALKRWTRASKNSVRTRNSSSLPSTSASRT